jgi:predicted nucleic acid-binding protein
MADYLVDTNVLLRALAIANPQKAMARQAIKTLLRDGAELCVAPQNLVEFWSVCTRPEKDNGLGNTVAATDRYCRFMESFLTILRKRPPSLRSGARSLWPTSFWQESA